MGTEDIQVWQMLTLTVVDGKLDVEVGKYSCCICLPIQVMLQLAHCILSAIADAEKIYSEICTIKHGIMKDIHNCGIKNKDINNSIAT